MSNWPDPRRGHGGPGVGPHQGPYVGPEAFSQPTPYQQPYQQPPYQQQPQPPYQQPPLPPVPPAAPWPAGGFPGPPGAAPPFLPRRRRRTPWILGIVAAVVVTVVVGVVVLVSTSGGNRKGTGGDAVKGYLEALARGDAKAALSYSNDQPASTELLTDEILKKQIAQWPITNIKILNEDSRFGAGEVHVVANFGNQISDTTLRVKRTDRGWKLEQAAIKVDLSNQNTENKALKTVTFFGKPVAQSGIYLFPGWDDVGTSNSNLSVTAKPLLLDRLSSYGAGLYGSDFTFELSDTGNQAVMSAVEDDLDQCTKSNVVDPPNCPVRVEDPSIVDGTVRWGKPDLSDLKISYFDPYRLTASVMGSARYPISANDRAGGTTTGTATAFVSATADVSKSPPEINWR
ncbi:DUF4878 domain-containing protein [Mycobacterium botniense]|uniref:DUF4878 domain-containing protein n=1 Tax=Mycobacterium botniense TaxID=84962 RepID=A0A7I9XU66_9MYCO|nr:DUF4878 domain-containing protein [Mycobacterium botniense]GFG73475.1 hypothetical protein MBOT_08400 [Mycobacterium botniense]